MTDHVTDRFIEADHYNVLRENRISELYPGEREAVTYCYCGNVAKFIARVGFHTRLDDPEEDTWPRTHSRDLKLHRCGEHRFEE